MNRVSKLDRAIQELHELQEIVDFREILRSRQASKLINELIKAMNGLRMNDTHTQETNDALYSQLFQVIEEVTGKLTEAGKIRIRVMFLNAGGIQDILDRFQLFCEELVQRQITNLEAERLDITIGIKKSVVDLDLPE